MVKRVVLLVLAAILLLLSIALGSAAAWGYSALGSDGVMRFDLGEITPDPATPATVIDVDRYSLSVPYIQDLGEVTLEATTGEIGDPSDVLFLGAASTADVDAYLKGTPYSVAVLIDGQWETRAVPGSATAAPPREQSFWLAASVGRVPAIQVPDQRPLTLVVTHPAGLPTGPFTLRFGFTVPDASTWILVMAGVAAVLLIIAVVLVIMAFRVKIAPKHRGKHEAEPVVDVVPVAAVAPEVDAVAVAEPEPVGVSEPEPVGVSEPEPEPVAVAEPEPATEVLPAMDDEPVTEAIEISDDTPVSDDVVDDAATSEAELVPVASEEPASDAEPEAPEPEAPEPDNDAKPGDAPIV